MTLLADPENEKFMRHALSLAKKGWGKTDPNPMVGAIIVENGQIVAEGFHQKAGGDHAEIAALKNLGRPPKPGATLFVTLEPCSTTGKTGPCTEAIINSGIKKVVIGTTDPNPRHAGRGIEILRQNGITIHENLLQPECEDLNLIFNHWITHNETFFAAKTATTLDGKIACRTGDSKWITNETSRADVMKWRRLFPAIGIGANTLLIDQPRLTSRIENEPEWCPTRFVFDGLLRTAHEKELPSLYRDEFRDRTIIVTTDHAGTGYVRRLANEGLTIWILPSETQRVPLDKFRSRCTEEGITAVYFEGGSILLSEMLQTKQIDYLFSYTAPLLLADDKAHSVLRGLRTEKIEHGIRLQQVKHASFKNDQLMRGFVTYPEKLSIDEISFRNR